MTTTTLQVRGMCCAEETNALRAEVGKVPGVRDVTFDLLRGRMSVRHDESTADRATIIEAVARTGLHAEPASEGVQQPAARESWWQRRGRLTMTVTAGVLLTLGFVTHVALTGFRAAVGMSETHAVPVPAIVLYLLSVIAGAWFVVPRAISAARRLRPDMHLLMTIAVVGAIGVSEYFEAAMVAFLFALSLLLESWSVGRARRAVESLLALSPPKARLLHGGHEREVDVAEVKVGSIVLVRPGEKIPLDGQISKGQTSVDQSPITGESMPVEKAEDDEVFAGSINQDGAIEVKTTKPADDTTLARIIRMVGEAQGRRAPSEQWVERFARWYTPLVIVLAVLVAILPPLLFGGVWSTWFYQALVLLVIACPCALVISTPVSIVAALTAAARSGVLVKGGVFMEAPARLRAIALDKTGTITEGRPTVQRVVPHDGTEENELLRIAASIESRSEHPLARAIVSHAQQQGVTFTPAENFQAIKGKGATASLNGQIYWIGSHAYLEESGHETPRQHDQLVMLSNDGASVVVVGQGDTVLGFLALSDRIREGSRAAIAGLRKLGVEHVVMLTGDNEPTARAIAGQAGVVEVRAELLPEQKVEAVEELVRRHGQVAMVGDGVNDAPAMARASLGIAMGAAGTDAAIETADIALMSDDLTRLPWLVRHSRHTLNIIRQNIIAALAVKVIFVLLTLMAWASLWAAIAADTGMSLAVVFNALRLLKTRSIKDSTS